MNIQYSQSIPTSRPVAGERLPKGFVAQRLHHFTALAALCLWGCGADGARVSPLDVPARPEPMPGQASLAGHVIDASGHGVQGATIGIAETDAVATTDASGAYQVDVPSDSTITLFASAGGMASTYRESVVLASGAMVTDFDVRLLTTTELAAVNMLGQPGVAAMRGAMAIQLHALDSGCTVAGAHVSVFPATAGTVVYSAPASGSGGLDLPDPTLQEVQVGATTAVWLATAMPSGNMLRIEVQKEGCQPTTESADLGGVMYPGLRYVAATSLTQADLFLQ